MLYVRSRDDIAILAVERIACLRHRRGYAQRDCRRIRDSFGRFPFS